MACLSWRIRKNEAGLQRSWPEWLEPGGFSLRRTEWGLGKDWESGHQASSGIWDEWDAFLMFMVICSIGVWIASLV